MPSYAHGNGSSWAAPTPTGTPGYAAAAAAAHVSPFAAGAVVGREAEVPQEKHRAASAGASRRTNGLKGTERTVKARNHAQRGGSLASPNALHTASRRPHTPSSSTPRRLVVNSPAKARQGVDMREMLAQARRESEEKSQLISILVEELKASQQHVRQLQVKGAHVKPAHASSAASSLTSADGFVWRERALAAEQRVTELSAKVAYLEETSTLATSASASASATYINKE